MNSKINDNGTYPPEHLDLQRMNRVMRHRLRNLCCGMKMALERVSEQTRSDYPNVGDNCIVMVSELENLLNFTTRMDLLFDSLPMPEPLTLFQIISHARQFFAEKHPFCSLKMIGPEEDLKIIPGTLVRLALEELLANAGELTTDEKVELKWEYGKGLKLMVESAFDEPVDHIPVAPPVPFMTNRGRHDGLGLAIVQRIADSIGGSFKFRQLSDERVITSIRIPARHIEMRQKDS
ncbi:hypothetical protein BVX99_01850 [bacterium F16]|nr:hypothetical protein BVX99_01850 [bacterium F16]